MDNTQSPVPLIHPLASQFLPAIYLFTVPIDLERAVERIQQNWGGPIQHSWDEVTTEGVRRGEVFHLEIDDVVVLISPITGAYPEPNLPPHTFHLQITAFKSHLPEDGDDSLTQYKLKRRETLQAASALTRLFAAFAQEEASVGVYRKDGGVLVTTAALKEYGERLSAGKFPTRLWVTIRTISDGVSSGRTFGLPSFSHLDVEVIDAPITEEELDSFLETVTEYIVGSDEFFIPGQSVNQHQIAQGISPIDDASVLRIVF